MARIIPLRGGVHAEVERLLPWYAIGRLEPHERARVERHLAECAICEVELSTERALSAEVVGLSPAVERGWAALRARISDTPAPRRARIAGAWRTMGSAGRAGWLIAAQVALVMIGGAAYLARPAPRANYHALSAVPVFHAGDAIVIFRPDATERAIAAALNAGGARVVDGPTAAEAYVLNVPRARLAAGLASLRANPAVVLAQPIDAGADR